MPSAVRSALTEYVRLADRFGPHELEERVEDVVRTEIHQRLSGLLNAPYGHTELFTAGATAFDALVGGLALGRHERIWTTPYESTAHLLTLQSVRDRTHCRLEVVPLNPDGDLDLEWMAGHIDNDVALVSVAHVPATRGIVNPVEEIGRLLAPYRALYAVDAAYSVGQLPVDIARIGCHLLTGDGWRFLCGPREVGFAYVAPRLRDRPTEWADTDPAPYPFDPDPFPATAAVAALNSALAQHAPDRHGHDLMPALLAAVEAAPGARPVTPGRRQSAILAFDHPQMPAGLLRHRLAEQGVAVAKTVAHQTPLLAPDGAATALRASLHPDTSQEGIDLFAQALDDVTGRRCTRRLFSVRERPLFVRASGEAALVGRASTGQRGSRETGRWAG
ncbi:aminotransferase class V-fold PLP-dependent enzyme [Streptomyces sp. NPDC016845]|uniref:aminotransferase class V-fold PLP-dependent enzyme n=1 Tax=Streptomyces sp. NPDC016845 TaxID=3364972 RepID=UPI0037939A14